MWFIGIDITSYLNSVNDNNIINLAFISLTDFFHEPCNLCDRDVDDTMGPYCNTAV